MSELNTRMVKKIFIIVFKSIAILVVIYLLFIIFAVWYSYDGDYYPPEAKNPITGETCDFGYKLGSTDCCDDDNYSCEINRRLGITDVNGNDSDYLYIENSNKKIDIIQPSLEIEYTQSTFINGILYDTDENYLIVSISGKNYEYCQVPLAIWEEFKKADSYGDFYNSKIKGWFSCN